MFLSAFEWVRSIETASEISRIVRICTGQTASPGGSWLREAQTDEGQYAPNICTAASIVLPDPHPALRATCPYPFCPFGTFPPDRGNRPPGEGVFGANLSAFAGKIQENRSGFLGRFKGSGGNSQSPGLFFFCQRFLLEKQKKMLNCTCKSVEELQPNTLSSSN